MTSSPAETARRHLVRHPIRRFVHRLPLLLERAGLPVPTGLFPVDWIVLETVGRRSGRPHVVVLDVIARDHDPDRFYVQPANGAASDWVRNVRHEPRVTARVGGRRFAAVVRDVTGSEGADAMLRFVRAHPRYARMVAWLVGHVRGLHRSDADLHPELRGIPTFAVEPSGR